jgi:succinyl-CoA synthetase alpha subunit
MAFLIDERTRVVVQGITGRQGRYAMQMLKAAGTVPVAGVTPGKGGETVDGVPVFDTVAEAASVGGGTATIIFVPAALVRDAALEAIDAGMSPIVLMVDSVPAGVALEIVTAAKAAGVALLGPNSPGIISPGKCMLAALRADFFTPGPVAVLSRSGGMMSTIASVLSTAGIGQSTCAGVGGDLVIGFDLPSAALLAEQDPETEAIAVFGELGTTQEERLAELTSNGTITKPVVAYIAGVSAKPGVRYSHAGAMAAGDESGGEAKRRALRAGGVHAVETYLELVDVLGGLISSPEAVA